MTNRPLANPLPGPHTRALRILVSRLRAADILWALTGSTAFGLQGLPIEPGDIDVQTDEAGAYAIELLFAEHVVRPVRPRDSARVASHFGALGLEEITVEIMGDIRQRAPAGRWQPPPGPSALVLRTDWDELRVPVLSLEYERPAYAELGRLDRARQLGDWLPGRVRLDQRAHARPLARDANSHRGILMTPPLGLKACAGPPRSCRVGHRRQPRHRP